jgi:hypothetical protein
MFAGSQQMKGNDEGWQTMAGSEQMKGSDKGRRTMIHVHNARTPWTADSARGTKEQGADQPLESTTPTQIRHGCWD